MTLKFTLLALLVTTTGQLVNAGFKTDCTDNADNHWDNSDRRVKNAVESNLSTCQRVAMGNMDANDIIIGGSGSGSINLGFKIEIGSGGGGCDSGGECMHDCQVLCCLTNGCNYANLKQDKKVKDYVVYVEEEIYYYCRMYSSGSLADSDSQSTCYANRPPVSQTYCKTLAASSNFKFDEGTYNYIKNLATDTSCSVNRKLAVGGVQAVFEAPKLEDVRAAIETKLAPLAKLKEGLQNLLDENDGDTCKARKSISQKVRTCPPVELLSDLDDDNIPGFVADGDDAPSGKGKGGGMSKQAKKGKGMGMGMGMGKGM